MENFIEISETTTSPPMPKLTVVGNKMGNINTTLNPVSPKINVLSTHLMVIYIQNNVMTTCVDLESRT